MTEGLFQKIQKHLQEGKDYTPSTFDYNGHRMYEYIIPNWDGLVLIVWCKGKPITAMADGKDVIHETMDSMLDLEESRKDLAAKLK